MPLEALPRDECTAAGDLGKWTSGSLNKFLQDEGAIMMSYSNINTFFSGLEGKVGSPAPQVISALSREISAASRDVGDRRSVEAATRFR